MATLALYGVLALGLMGGLFLLAVRFLPAGEQIAPPVRDEPVWTLAPDRTLTATDIAELRLPVSLRGYRFAETDELLDRLVEELNGRDAELQRLSALLIAHDISPEPPPAPEPTGEAHDDPAPAPATADGEHAG